MPVPEMFAAGRLSARRITARDKGFVTRLMTLPAMNAHKPDPTPPRPAQVSDSLDRDLEHWNRHGFGRYVVSDDTGPIGLCGLTRRDGFRGLNLSYHLSPDHWGHGYATELVTALVDIARSHLADQDQVFALARPANPGSTRVLEKCGFSQIETLDLGGAPTRHYVRVLPA